MPKDLREYLNSSQKLRDIESSTLSSDFGKMSTDELNGLLNNAAETFLKCRSEESQAVFDRIETRIRYLMTQNPESNPSVQKPNPIHNPRETSLKKIGLGLFVFALSLCVLWSLKHYFNVELY